METDQGNSAIENSASSSTPKPTTPLNLENPSPTEIRNLQQRIWNANYITRKEIWADRCGPLGSEFRFWGTDFDFYKIKIDKNGKITKTKTERYANMEECLKKEKVEDVISFFLNYVCDTTVMNDLRKSNLDTLRKP